jgi:hypothetical protein
MITLRSVTVKRDLEWSFGVDLLIEPCCILVKSNPFNPFNDQRERPELRQKAADACLLYTIKH